MNKKELFKSFAPGENLQIKDIQIKSKRPEHEGISIISPVRVHFSLIDYTEMTPPLPGGGGIGISCSNFLIKANIKILENRSNRISQIPSINHIAILFSQLVKYDPYKISIELESTMPSHGGYGSNVATNTAVFLGLNKMFGVPFSEAEIYDILTHNYIESTDNHKIHWGFDTGVGEAALIFGGMVLIDETGNYYNNIKFDDYYIVIAQGNMSRFAQQDYLNRGLDTKGETGIVEAQINESIGMIHQREYGERLSTYFHKTLMPIFKEKNKEKLKAEIWRLNKLGTFKRMQMSYNKKIMLDFENFAKAAGAFYAGISSAGPAMFALFESELKAKSFSEASNDKFIPYLSNFTVGKTGGKIEFI